LPRALNTEYIILISEEIKNYRRWQEITGFDKPYFHGLISMYIYFVIVAHGSTWLSKA